MRAPVLLSPLPPLGQPGTLGGFQGSGHGRDAPRCPAPLLQECDAEEELDRGEHDEGVAGSSCAAASSSASAPAEASGSCSGGRCAGGSCADACASGVCTEREAARVAAVRAVDRLRRQVAWQSVADMPGRFGGLTVEQYNEIRRMAEQLSQSAASAGMIAPDRRGLQLLYGGASSAASSSSSRPRTRGSSAAAAASSSGASPSSSRAGKRTLQSSAPSAPAASPHLAAAAGEREGPGLHASFGSGGSGGGEAAVDVPWLRPASSSPYGCFPHEDRGNGVGFCPSVGVVCAAAGAPDSMLEEANIAGWASTLDLCRPVPDVDIRRLIESEVDLLAYLTSEAASPHDVARMSSPLPHPVPPPSPTPGALRAGEVARSPYAGGSSARAASRCGTGAPFTPHTSGDRATGPAMPSATPPARRAPMPAAATETRALLPRNWRARAPAISNRRREAWRRSTTGTKAAGVVGASGSRVSR
eukprot:TRINITY_DN46828_c0_g1_i1.p1 TRINITY_DN46828_c0_g1~~TRINITY_DN46828_c0_g1_i1.p1  ORF type:complete len:474 (+),score=91.90 TRINITY_DN46828_c0_g1_i1:100-1521(+)